MRKSVIWTETCPQSSNQSRDKFIISRLHHTTRSSYTLYSRKPGYTWPISKSSTLCCASCGGPLNLSTQPLPIPISFDASLRQIIVSGDIVHSVACGKRYYIDRGSAIGLSLPMFLMMAERVFKARLTPPAPPVQTLIARGGGTTFDEYVDVSGQVKIREVPKCLIPEHVTMELEADAPARCVEDAARVHWDVTGIRRPPEMPSHPAVDTAPRGTLLDELAASRETKRKRGGGLQSEPNDDEEEDDDAEDDEEGEEARIKSDTRLTRLQKRMRHQPLIG